MTVRINFLPRNYQPPKQLGAREWGMAAAAAVTVVATGLFYMGVYANTASVERNVQSNQLKLQGVKAQLAEAADIRTREERVTRAETDLKSLAGRHWSGTLLTLRELTPQHVTWTGLKVDKNEMTLAGTSRGLLDIAQLMGGLVADTAVEMVALRFANEKGIPITVTLTNKGGTKADKDALAETTKELGVFRQLEFEMVITLVPSEGRQLPHGS